MVSLIDLFYGQAKKTEREPSRVAPPVPAGASVEALKATMWQELVAFQRWMAGFWQEISSEVRQGILSDLERLQEKMDAAYREGNWAAFQSALAQGRVVVSQVRVGRQTLSTSGHWTYRVWSGVLDSEVWWVHCGVEAETLTSKGISRGAIYTESELKELICLPRPCNQALKDIHLLKLYFDGTVMEEERHGHRNNR